MNNKETLNELIEEWLSYKKDTLKESTYYRYSYILNKYIISHFENIEIEKIENYEFNILVAELNKRLNPTSVKNVITLLKSILIFAKKKYGYYFNYNSISLPQSHKEENRILSKKEKRKLENYCLKNNTLKDIGIIICLNTGLKIGEICALKWSCINLKNRTIEVKYTIQRIYNKLENKTKVVISEINQNQV